MPTHLARHVIFAAVAIEGLSLRPVRTFSRLHAARTACIRSFMPVEGCLPEGLLLPEQSNLTLGLQEEADVAAVASVLVRCFYESAARAGPTTQMPAADGAGVRDESERTQSLRRGWLPGDAQDVAEELPPSELSALPQLHERWRTACRGLRWRLGARLQPLDGLATACVGGSDDSGGGSGGDSGGSGGGDSKGSSHEAIKKRLICGLGF